MSWVIRTRSEIYQIPWYICLNFIRQFLLPATYSSFISSFVSVSFLSLSISLILLYATHTIRSEKDGRIDEEQIQKMEEEGKKEGEMDRYRYEGRGKEKRYTRCICPFSLSSLPFIFRIYSLLSMTHILRIGGNGRRQIRKRKKGRWKRTDTKEDKKRERRQTQKVKRTEK